MQIFFDQPVKNDLRTYDNFWKIAIDQGDDDTTTCLLDYNCCEKNYELIVINLSRQ